MKPVPPLTRDQFDMLLQDQQQVLTALNQLETCVYQLGEQPDDSPTAQCQVAAGVLIGQLRDLLFKWDQQALPALEALVDPQAGE